MDTVIAQTTSDSRKRDNVGRWLWRLVRRLRGVEDYEVRDYELYTLKAIRAHSFRLRWRSTESLCRAYRQWSTTEYCAGWISLDASCIGRFTKWALTASINDDCA